MSAPNEKVGWTVFTAQGSTCDVEATTPTRALHKARCDDASRDSGRNRARRLHRASGGRSRDCANRAGAKRAIAMSTPAVAQNAPTSRCKARANGSAKQRTIQTPAEDVAGRTAQSQESVGLDVEAWVPKTQSAFRINQVAEFLSCTAQHIFNLVNAGEIQVPAENIARAASRPGIMVPRKSLVAFLRARSTSNPVWRKNRIAKKEAAAGNANGTVSANAKAKGRRIKAS